MLSKELANELDIVAARIGRITKLAPSEAEALLAKLAEAYVADRSYLRWWESLKVPARSLDYGDGNGLSFLANLVVSQSSALLIVTDEEHPPWPVYLGSAGDIVEMLRGLRFFEFIMTSPDMKWIVFDTHMNRLLTVGSLTA